MNKKLVATKCKDSWLVDIKQTVICGSKTDVIKLIRYEGLKQKKEFGTEDKLYAD